MLPRLPCTAGSAAPGWGDVVAGASVTWARSWSTPRWHIVGQAIGTVFRRFPVLGALAAFLLVGAGLYFAGRWFRRRRRTQRPYQPVGRGPRDW